VSQHIRSDGQVPFFAPRLAGKVDHGEAASRVANVQNQVEKNPILPSPLVELSGNWHQPHGSTRLPSREVRFRTLSIELKPVTRP
jgi:hypothetical protein